MSNIAVMVQRMIKTEPVADPRDGVAIRPCPPSSLAINSEFDIRPIKRLGLLSGVFSSLVN